MASAQHPLTGTPQKQTKLQIVETISQDTGIGKREITAVLQSLAETAKRHLMNSGSGEFVVPELGVKLRRVHRPATKPRKGRNPLTGEEIIIQAKPARQSIKATLLKPLKDIFAPWPPVKTGRTTPPVPAPVPRINSGPAASLFGRWKSDKEATQKEAEKTVIGEQDKQSLYPLFGRLITTFTPTEFTTEYEGQANTYAYRIVGSGSNFVEIEYHDAARDTMERKRVYVEGDTLWIALPGYGFPEVFKRVT